MAGVRVKDAILLDSVHVGVSIKKKSSSILVSNVFGEYRKLVVYFILLLVGTVVLDLGLELKVALYMKKIVP